MAARAIEDLLSHQAITETIYRYCRSLDRMDKPMALSVWHPGGTADYGKMFQGTGAGFIDWVWEQHARMMAHSHQVTNIFCDVKNESAVSEAYVTVVLLTDVRPGHQSVYTGRGRYVDRWSKRAGIWAIDHRRYIHDFGEVHEGPNPDAERAGRRDRQDPSYDLLRMT